MPRVSNTSDQTKMVRLSGAAQSLATAETLPTELKLFNPGVNPSDVGDILVDEVSLAALERQVAGKSFAQVLIDFEHNSEPGTEKYVPPPRRHAGYGDLVPLSSGVFLKNIRWTDAGKQFARDYADLSPTVKLSAKNQLTFVKSLALCPNGAVHNLTFLSSKPENDPIEKEIQEMDELKTLSATVTTQAETIKTLSATVEQQKVEIGKIETLSSAVATQAETIKTLSADVTALQADVLKRDKQLVLDAAAREGKAVALSAEAVAKLSIEDLRAHVEKLVPTVPLSARTPKAIRENKDVVALMAEYNAIQEPEKRAEFWDKNREKMFGKN
jgi:uncharacterized coiled-coil protein SlyX